MDLRLYHIERSGQKLGTGHRFVNRKRGVTCGNGNAKLCEQFLALIFMDVHR